MTSPRREAELAASVISGDREAFDSIMRVHEDRVVSVCLRILGDRQEALDAAQDTFLSVFRKAHQFKAESTLGTWIYRIAVNSCYDRIRKSKRRSTVPFPDHLDPTDPSAEAAIESAGMRPEIANALSSLSTDFRSAVVLSDIEGMTMPEVARVLGVPVGTAKSRVFRGRRLLAKKLGNEITS